MRDIPKKIQSVIMLGEFQAHVGPAKVNTIMNKTKVDAFNTAPNQSIESSFSLMLIDGRGLCLGKSMM